MAILWKRILCKGALQVFVSCVHCTRITSLAMLLRNAKPTDSARRPSRSVEPHCHELRKAWANEILTKHNKSSDGPPLAQAAVLVQISLQFAEEALLPATEGDNK